MSNVLKKFRNLLTNCGVKRKDLPEEQAFNEEIPLAQEILKDTCIKDVKVITVKEISEKIEDARRSEEREAIFSNAILPAELEEELITKGYKIKHWQTKDFAKPYITLSW